MTNYEKYSKDVKTLSEFFDSLICACEEDDCNDCRFGKCEWCPQTDIEGFLNSEMDETIK